MGKWLLMMVVLLAAPAFGSAYKWVDESGQVHYSDRPIPGAEEITLLESPVPPAPQTLSGETAPEPTASPASTESYRNLRITSPTQQATLWNIEGILNVSVDLSPRLRRGHRIAVNLDGNLVDLRPTGSTFQVPDVFRGTHTLDAVVLDRLGEVLIRSDGINFMVQQTSILNPNRPATGPLPGPARPRPRG